MDTVKTVLSVHLSKTKTVFTFDMPEPAFKRMMGCNIKTPLYFILDDNKIVVSSNQTREKKRAKDVRCCKQHPTDNQVLTFYLKNESACKKNHVGEYHIEMVVCDDGDVFFALPDNFQQQWKDVMVKSKEVGEDTVVEDPVEDPVVVSNASDDLMQWCANISVEPDDIDTACITRLKSCDQDLFKRFDKSAQEGLVKMFNANIDVRNSAHAPKFMATLVRKRAERAYYFLVKNNQDAVDLLLD